MATIFTHPLLPLAARIGLGKFVISNRLVFWAMVATIVPDFDVIAFRFDISYASEWGHRGFTHSLAFAAAIGGLGVWLYKYFQTTRLVAFLTLFFSTASHGVLDALTDGGLGIAFFWPLTPERFFFPWRPLEVSPIGASNFFNSRGAMVLYSELLWLVIPLAIVTFILLGIRRAQHRKAR